MNDNVTFVLTSCGRVGLLERTITSFIKYNTYPIDRYILIDDSADIQVFKDIENLNEKLGNIFELHFNYEKIGQVRSVDKLHSMVSSDYIFHCEDDWEFYNPDFIKKSIDVFKEDEKILQVLIRPKTDSLSTGMSSVILQTKNGTKYRKVVPVSYLVDPAINRWVRNYGGFTLNPALKRTSDYKLLPSYTSISDKDGCEEPVDKFYSSLGFYVVSLSESDSDGYVRHIGWEERSKNHIW
jgi:hypothetical protein